MAVALQQQPAESAAEIIAALSEVRSLPSATTAGIGGRPQRVPRRNEAQPTGSPQR